MTGRYDRYDYLDEKRDALARWGRHLETLIRAAPDNARAADAQCAEPISTRIDR